MYLYRTRNLSTNEFYFGYSEDNKSKFNPLHDLDPHRIFGESKYIEKRLIAEVSSIEDLEKYFAKYEEGYKLEPLYLGIIGFKKVDPIEEVKPIKELLPTGNVAYKKSELLTNTETIEPLNNELPTFNKIDKKKEETKPKSK